MEQDFTREQLEELLKEAASIQLVEKDGRSLLIFHMPHGAETILPDSVFAEAGLSETLQKRLTEIPLGEVAPPPT